MKFRRGFTSHDENKYQHWYILMQIELNCTCILSVRLLPTTHCHCEVLSRNKIRIANFIYFSVFSPFSFAFSAFVFPFGFLCVYGFHPLLAFHFHLAYLRVFMDLCRGDRQQQKKKVFHLSQTHKKNSNPIITSNS